MDVHCVNMDLVGWIWLVVLCSWLLRASIADSMGRKMLTELHGASPILLEMGCWETILCIWAILAIFAIFSISMARSKNTGKGKAPSFSNGASREKTEGRYFADCKEKKGEM